jgi:hypothetical protein
MNDSYVRLLASLARRGGAQKAIGLVDSRSQGGVQRFASNTDQPGSSMRLRAISPPPRGAKRRPQVCE